MSEVATMPKSVATAENEIPLTIDKELDDLLPEQSAEEILELTESIKTEGCRDKLVAWRENGKRILVDGYTRHRICTRHKKPFEVVDREFPDRAAVKQWMVTNQFARRNLIPAVRIELALKLKPDLEKAAAQRQKTGQKQEESDTSENLPEGRAREAVADIAGVSGRTVAKMENVLDEGTSALRQAVRDNRVSIDTGSIAAKKCSSEVQDALANGVINTGDMKDLSEHPVEKQALRLARMLDVRAKHAARQAEMLEKQQAANGTTAKPKPKPKAKPTDPAVAIDEQLSELTGELFILLDSRAGHRGWVAKTKRGEHHAKCADALDDFRKACKEWVKGGKEAQ